MTSSIRGILSWAALRPSSRNATATRANIEKLLLQESSKPFPGPIIAEMLGREAGQVNVSAEVGGSQKCRLALHRDRSTHHRPLFSVPWGVNETLILLAADHALLAPLHVKSAT